MTSATNPLRPFLTGGAVLLLDGGLATTLEARGHDLGDALWSARLLLEDPAAIAAVHADFLAAGADVITTASYQASAAGFATRGLDETATADLLRLSCALALAARDEYQANPARRAGRPRPLVAASVGPYGAALADGSEYRGGYDLDRPGLLAFHEPRWRVLAGAGADLLACETIPSRLEAEVLLSLLASTPDTWAWLSFSCADERHLCDGGPLAEAVALCDAAPRVAAVGINCTAPAHLAGLITAARAATGKPVIVYPNRGEAWDAGRKVWRGGPEGEDWCAALPDWLAAGAVGVGGCCRVGPAEIADLGARLAGCHRR